MKQVGKLASLKSIRFFGSGEIAAFDIGDVVLYCIGHYRREVGISAEEARGEPFVDSEHIVHDEHLTINTAACTDADYRDVDLFCHTGSEFSGDLFKHESEATDLFKEFGILNQFFCLLLFTGTDVVGAEFVDALGG